MATFVIIPTAGITGIEKKLPKTFGNKALRLPNGEWLVSYSGTSQQLSDEVGISESPDGSAIVLNFSAYYGRASANIWEWIKENGES